jgi:hypothetical protein
MYAAKRKSAYTLSVEDGYDGESSELLVISSGSGRKASKSLSSISGPVVSALPPSPGHGEREVCVGVGCTSACLQNC